MTWADAMGLVVLEGLVILVLVLTGFREAVFHAVPAQLKIAISRRHRPVHRAHRPRRRRLRAPHPGRRQHHGPGAARRRRLARRLAGAGLRVRPGCWSSRSTSARCKGAILISIVATTVLAIVVEAIAHVGPSVAGDKVNPNGWNLNVPALPDKIVDVPDFGAARPVLAVRLLRAGRRRHRACCSSSR